MDTSLDLYTLSTFLYRIELKTFKSGKNMENEYKIILYGGVSIYWAWKLHEIFIRKKQKPKTRKIDNYSKLLTATLGDKNKRKRLIKYEMNRDESINYEQAAMKAIERLQRDRK